MCRNRYFRLLKDEKWTLKTKKHEVRWRARAATCLSALKSRASSSSRALLSLLLSIALHVLVTRVL